MKKRKILLLSIIGIIGLFLNVKVYAAEPIMGYLECKYDFNNENMSSTGLGGTKKGIITLYFSELNIDGGLANELLYETIDWSSNGYGKISNDVKYLFYPSNPVGNEMGKISGRFKTVYEESKTSCPKFLALKKLPQTGWIFKTDNYTPYFANEKTEYCGSDLSSCWAVGTSISNAEKIVLYGNEKEWNFSVSGDGSCDGANVRLSLSGTKLVGTISYPKTSSFYEKSSKKEVTVDVKIDGEKQYLNFVYDLIKNNSIKKAFIRGDSGNEKIIFNDSGVSSNSCDIAQNKVTDVKYNCKRYTEIESQLKQHRNKWEQIKTEFNNFFATVNYSDDASIETLSALADDIDNYTNSNKRGGTILTYYENYQKFMKDNYEDLCTEDKTKVEEMTKTLANDNEDINAKVESLKNTLEKIKTRLTELNADEEVKKLNGYLENNNDFQKEIKRYYSVTRVTNLIDGLVNLTFNEGCGLFSSDLKDWLIRFLDIIKIVALILTIILGMVDFLKATLSNDSDAMKKAWKHFSRRLIAVCLLFLMPVVIEFLMNLVSINGVDATNPLCDIK